jgi:DNA repair protein RecN (Recombination protein N)
MLSSLTIKNVVLIESLTIEFENGQDDNGLSALTGETGAGKSILLDSLGLALGARSESRLVRQGADKAQVLATFDIPSEHSCYRLLHEADVEVDAGENLLLRRSLTSDGRSKAYINDAPISVGLLREVGESLVEIHGQHDTRGLLDPSTHKNMLDAYADIDAAKIANLWRDWQGKLEELNALREKAQSLKEQEQYLRESVEDLDALGPEPEEDARLSLLRESLKHREDVLGALNEAYHALNADSDPVRSAWGILDRVSDKLGGIGQQAIAALDSAVAEATEALALIQSASSDLEHSEYNLESIDDRLHALRNAARKHNCSVDNLAAKRDELSAELALIDNNEEHIRSLENQVTQAREAYIKEAKILHDRRVKAGSKMDALVEAELAPLKMERAKFVTSVETQEEQAWGVYGIDKIRFLVATNPGSAPGPLNKIASGGEMSRFMLALKVVMADESTKTRGQKMTMIFDEVDAGIGGATADAVGERLSALASVHQVLVVTHSPQVAARAGAHWIVQKAGDVDVTTNVVRLPEAMDRREEIARMLAGSSITDEARAAAEKLLSTGA